MCDHIPENVTLDAIFLSNGFGPVIVRIGFTPLGASLDVTLKCQRSPFLGYSIKLQDCSGLS